MNPFFFLNLVCFFLIPDIYGSDTSENYSVNFQIQREGKEIKAFQWSSQMAEVSIWHHYHNVFYNFRPFCGVSKCNCFTRGTNVELLKSFLKEVAS